MTFVGPRLRPAAKFGHISSTWKGYPYSSTSQIIDWIGYGHPSGFMNIDQIGIKTFKWLVSLIVKGNTGQF